ncbi:hypothetical protein JHK87_052466 [Glycine soja]|nr:hypothetical protein JHK87_052466 [Glycine soja]
MFSICLPHDPRVLHICDPRRSFSQLCLTCSKIRWITSSINSLKGARVSTKESNAEICVNQSGEEQVPDVSPTMGALDGKNSSSLNLKETELRLNLPGCESPERKSGGKCDSPCISTCTILVLLEVEGCGSVTIVDVVAVKTIPHAWNTFFRISLLQLV